MATINIIDPASGNTKQISVNMEASMVVQDLLGEIEYFVSLSTTAKTVTGASIAKRNISALSSGAGGGTNDRHGDALSGGQYANLTDAIDDYVAMMVEGDDADPSTEMAFV